MIQVRRAIATKKVSTVSTQPVQPKSVEKTHSTYHVVTKGDTLYSVGRRYGISVDQLRTMNKLDKNSAIYVGQKLAVK